MSAAPERTAVPDRPALEALVAAWNEMGAEPDRDYVSAASFRVAAQQLRAKIDDADRDAAPETATPHGGEWAVLELLGHRQAIGRISETTLARRQMIKIERIDTEPEGTAQYYGPESVYCLTPVTEQQARLLASQRYKTRVVPLALTAARDHDEADGDPWGGDPLGDIGDSDREEWAREGAETAMSATERAEYDRDSEFRLDAADEARDLEREDSQP